MPQSICTSEFTHRVKHTHSSRRGSATVSMPAARSRTPAYEVAVRTPARAGARRAHLDVLTPCVIVKPCRRAMIVSGPTVCNSTAYGRRSRWSTRRMRVRMRMADALSVWLRERPRLNGWLNSTGTRQNRAARDAGDSCSALGPGEFSEESTDAKCRHQGWRRGALQCKMQERSRRQRTTDKWETARGRIS